MTDDGIQQVLDEVRAVSAELIEIKADVKLALTHGGDIKALRADIIRIDTRLSTIDDFINGDPPLEARLARLEVKQEKDRKTAAHDTAVAEDKQETVNTGFRAKFAELFSSVNLLQGASLKLQASIMLVGAIAIYVLARALGA